MRSASSDLFQVDGAHSLRHGATSGRNPAELARFMTMFKIMFEAEGIHPLEGGIVRLKYLRDRRYGMKIEPIGVFNMKLAAETWRKLKIYGRLAWQGWRIGQTVKNDPKRHEYMDLALSPVIEEDPAIYRGRAPSNTLSRCSRSPRS